MRRQNAGNITTDDWPTWNTSGDEGSVKEELPLPPAADVVYVLHEICQAIADKKGTNVIVLDVRNLCSLTDYFVIAEGTVHRHVIAVAQHVISRLQEIGISPIRTEGLPEGAWIVLDYMDIVIHVMTHEFRDRYAIEEIWKEGRLIPIEVSYTQA